MATFVIENTHCTAPSLESTVGDNQKGAQEADGQSLAAYTSQAPPPLLLPADALASDSIFAGEQYLPFPSAMDDESEAGSIFPTLLSGPPPGLALSPKRVEVPTSPGMVLGYGPHGSPKRAGRVSMPASLPSTSQAVLTYGPHGSPRRASQNGHALAPAAHMAAVTSVTRSTAVLSYGPCGSPKKGPPRAAPALPQQAVFGYGPHGALKHEAMRAVPAPPMLSGVFARAPPPLTMNMGAPGLPAPASRAATSVLSYGPHGSPKRNSRRSVVSAQPRDTEEVAASQWLESSYPKKQVVHQPWTTPSSYFAADPLSMLPTVAPVSMVAR